MRQDVQLELRRFPVFWKLGLLSTPSPFGANLLCCLALLDNSRSPRSF